MELTSTKLKFTNVLTNFFLIILISVSSFMMLDGISSAADVDSVWNHPPDVSQTRIGQFNLPLESTSAFQLSATQVQTDTTSPSSEDSILVPLAPDDPGIVLNEAELIDTLIKWFAWVWLCFGGCALASLFIIFPLLLIRGSQLQRQQVDVEVVDDDEDDEWA